MKTVRILGSFLARIIGKTEDGLLAFLRFTEEDASILLSAYGFHAPEIERLEKSRCSDEAQDETPP